MRTNPDWRRKSVVANEKAEAAHVENDWEEDKDDRWEQSGGATRRHISFCSHDDDLQISTRNRPTGTSWGV